MSPRLKSSSSYDYEEVSSEAANMMIAHIYGQGASSLEGKVYGNDKIIKFDDFEYTDPIDQSVSKKQVHRNYPFSRYFD